MKLLFHAENEEKGAKIAKSWNVKTVYVL